MLTLEWQVEGGSSGTISCPDRDHILKAVSILPRDGSASLAALKWGEMTYMQTDGVGLEYQEGSLDFHYECPPEFVSAENISRAFLSYARGDDQWRHSVPWRKWGLGY